MIVPSSENVYSDDSEDEIEEIDIYRRKYQLLLERCEVLQQDNERLCNRIQQVKKFLHRSRRERKFLMDRLDRYGDNWRTAPLPLELDEPIDMPTSGQTSQSSVKTPKTASGISDKSIGMNNRKSATGSAAPTKRKAQKPPVDPNAPKRPANPFFQFCQEQRSIVLENLVSLGQGEPTKQEVTKHLATKWNALSTDDKKVYYDMYEKSKERYAVDMQLYSLNRGKTP